MARFCVNKWSAAVTSEYTQHQFWNNHTDRQRLVRILGCIPYAIGASGINIVRTNTQAPNLELITGAVNLSKPYGPGPEYTYYDGDSLVPAPSGFIKLATGTPANGVDIFGGHPVIIHPGTGVDISGANANTAIQITVWFEEFFERS